MEKINQLIDKILQNRFLTHVLYWLASILLWTIIGNFIHGNLWYPFTSKLCYLPAQMMATYFLIYYQIPKLIYRKKYVAFLFSFVGSLYLFSAVARFFKIYVHEPLTGWDAPQESIFEILTQPTPLLERYSLEVYLFATFTVLVKLLKDHFAARQELELLQRDKVNAELGFLKAQLHPHFLFNTLNNLYTLTLIKSPEAPDMIQKLADMLDYTLYQKRDKEIPIQKEVELIQNYIDLELLRYDDRLDLQFHKDLKNTKQSIAPLVLLSMVENAFKHGASGDHKRPKIHINLMVTDIEIFFSVFNTKPQKTQSDISGYKKGIGVNNVKRQLTLLYPNQHTLEINDKEESYEIELCIKKEVSIQKSGASIPAYLLNS